MRGCVIQAKPRSRSAGSRFARQRSWTLQIDCHMFDVTLAPAISFVNQPGASAIRKYRIIPANLAIDVVHTVTERSNFLGSSYLRLLDALYSRAKNDVEPRRSQDRDRQMFNLFARQEAPGVISPPPEPASYA